ncbi:MAG: LIC12162 family protein [Magnetospirillum sp. WYHS-4]
MTAKARLFLSTIPDDFDPTRDAALGPWCFGSSESVWPEWEFQGFSDPFPDFDDLRREVTRCHGLTAWLLPRVGEALNARHGTRHGSAFWWVQLVPWLKFLAEAAWIRWNWVAAFANRGPGQAFAVETFAGAEAVNWRFADSGSFIDDGLLDPDFDFWLLSLIVERQTPPSWRILPRPGRVSLPEERDRASQPPTHTSALRQFARRLFGRLPFNSVHGMSLAVLPFSALAALKPAKPALPPLLPEPISARPAGLPGPFLALLEDILVPATMPMAFLDDFARLEAEAAAKAYRPGRLLVTTATIYNDAANREIGFAMEAGERVVRTQHGAVYGCEEFTAQVELLEYYHDAFVTWGWTEQDDLPGRFLPLPSPFLSKLANRHRETTGDLVLVGTRSRLRPNQVDPVPRNGYWPAHRREKVAFLEGLPAALRGRTRYRPYLRARAEMLDLPYMQAQVPGLAVVDGDLTRTLLGCRLAAIDHPGTTLAVALAADVPTLCFFDPDCWAFSRQARPLVEALRQTGILHPSGTAAAVHAAAVWNDIPGWWRSPSVQKARQDWCRRYAWGDRFWWWHWAKEIARL